MTAPPFTRHDIDGSIVRRFEAIVDACPSRLALTGPEGRWTYAQLNTVVNRAAHAAHSTLHSRTVSALPSARSTHGPPCVAVFTPHSAHMVIGVLAAQKTGCAYAAIHPAHPDQTIHAQVTVARPQVVFTTAALATRAREIMADAARVVVIDALGAGWAESNPVASVDPDAASTIFHTSGSTGRPKSVVKSHRAVLHRVWLSTQYDRIREDDCQSLLTHAAFSAAEADMFGPLLQGASVAVFDPRASGFSAMRAWLEHSGVTLFHPPVSLLRRFLGSLEAGDVIDTVRLVALAGEAVRPADVAAWRRHFRGGELHHRFSSTETALLTLARVAHDSEVDEGASLAGVAVADKHLEVVDATGRAVPTGDEGTLVVSSRYVALGYLDGETGALNAFEPDASRPGARRFQTGDRGALLPDGRFVFAGRRDRQVKVRGFRVELDEVEDALRAAPGIAEAAVLAVAEDGSQQIVGFVETRDRHAFDEAAVRAHVQRTVAEWKCPAVLTHVPALPMTPSGKVDRGALAQWAPRPAGEARRSGGEPRSASAVGDQNHPATAVDRGVPRGDTEVRIAALWADVLGRPPESPTADFFASGGDSLMAATLHARLERDCRVAIPLDHLMAVPSVVAMAVVIDRLTREGRPRDATSRPPVMTPVRRGGHLPPVFLVHGRRGHAYAQSHVLDALGGHPVYSFQATGLDPHRLPHCTIEMMAEAYRGATQPLTTDGPYLLVGMCAGGLICVAMAQQLRRMGHDVAPLLLIDPPPALAGELPWWRRWRRIVRARRALARVRDDAVARAELAFELARLRFRGWRYDGPVFLLRSDARLRVDKPEDARSWSSHFTGTVRTIEIGERHRNIKQEHNDRLAAGLQVWAEEVAMAAVKPRSAHQASKA